MAEIPPHYDDAEIIPHYSPSSPPSSPVAPRSFITHAFKNRNLQVTVRSYAKTEDSTPVFIKGAPLTGEVTISFNALEKIKELSVNVSTDPLDKTPKST